VKEDAYFDINRVMLPTTGAKLCNYLLYIMKRVGVGVNEE
jgi:hypothetical protein